MVAQLSDDDAAMPSLVAATPASCAVTPTKDNRSPRTRRNRISISPKACDESLASASQELFGDFVSIEKIAAQTEKAYETRKLNSPKKTYPPMSPASSPSRISKQLKFSPNRSKPKKSVSKTEDLLSLNKRTYMLGGTVLVLVFVLPLLLCETLLFALTLRYNNVSDQSSFAAAGVPGSELTQNDSIAEQYSSSAEDLGSIESVEQQNEETADDVPLTSREELETTQMTMSDYADNILNYRVMLDDAFAIIAESRSMSVRKKSIEKIQIAETMCKNILSRANEVGSFEDYQSFGVAETYERTVETNAWRLLHFKSQLCIGGVKISMSLKDDEFTLQQAKDVFEHLSHLDPHSVDAQAGLGSSLLALGVTGSRDQVKKQESLLTLASFHLKLASSLVSTKHKADSEGVSISDDSEIKDVSLEMKEMENDKQVHHSTHAAIFHNLALAYIALGDVTGQSVPLLLRAAAIHRQLDPEELFWNLPNELMHVVEEKAWLLGAKSKGNKMKKKRRVPFVPESFTFDEMIDI